MTVTISVILTLGSDPYLFMCENHRTWSVPVSSILATTKVAVARLVVHSVILMAVLTRDCTFTHREQQHCWTCPGGLGPVGFGQQLAQWEGLGDSVLWCVQSASALAQQMLSSCWAWQTAAAGNSTSCVVNITTDTVSYTVIQEIDMINLIT